MRAYSRWIYPVFLAVLLSVGSRAEETKPAETAAPAEDEGKIGWLFVEAAGWLAEGKGLDYAPATFIGSDGTSTLDFPSGTEQRFRYRVGYLFNHNIGEVLLTWYSHDQEREIAQYNPGVFAYGESPVYPINRGINDDGLADGLLVDARTRARDLRIDFQRVGYESPRMTFRWLIGFRRVEQERRLDGTYYSIFPVYNGQALPPFLFPQNVSSPNPLAPTPDVALVASQFNGRGPEAGAEVTFPLGRRIYLETGFTLALLSGQMDTQYSSTTHFYALMDSSKTSIQAILLPPYSEFNDPDLFSYIQQFDVPIAVSSQTTITAQAMETYLGIRWKAWRGLETFAGFRSARYDNVGADVKPSQVSLSMTSTGRVATTVGGVTRTNHSSIYEGFYFGLSYKY